MSDTKLRRISPIAEPKWKPLEKLAKTTNVEFTPLWPIRNGNLLQMLMNVKHASFSVGEDGALLEGMASLTFEPKHDKTNKMSCGPSKDSDQPGHPPSLIRVFAVRSVGR